MWPSSVGDAACHLSVWTCCHVSIAVYPSTMDEQPLDADILDLATRRWCGTPCRRGARWALTPPFHPYRQVSAVIFCHLNPEVTPSFPLRNAMLCVARTFLKQSMLPATSRPTA